MESVCPLCNKLKNINVCCEKCGEEMIDLGRVQDFSDPYGPQFPINDALNYCIHLFHCEECNNRRRVRIGKIDI